MKDSGEELFLKDPEEELLLAEKKIPAPRGEGRQSGSSPPARALMAPLGCFRVCKALLTGAICL